MVFWPAHFGSVLVASATEAESYLTVLPSVGVTKINLVAVTASLVELFLRVRENRYTGTTPRKMIEIN